jgi:hypothetical protein
VRQELDTALGDASRALQAEGVGMEQRAIAAALPANDRKRLGVTPEEIAAVLHTICQGAKYLSIARAESREEFIARLTSAVPAVFAGLGIPGTRTP